MAEPPNGLGPLLTPDGVTGIIVAVCASLVAAFNEQVRGWAIVMSGLSAAIVTAVAMPIAIHRGFTWSDYLGIVPLVCGVMASSLFVIALVIRRKLQERSDEVANGVVGWLLDKFLPRKGGQ